MDGGGRIAPGAAIESNAGAVAESAVSPRATHGAVTEGWGEGNITNILLPLREKEGMREKNFVAFGDLVLPVAVLCRDA